MPAPDVVAFVRASLPPRPARVLEVGAGDGSLAAALEGYDVVAIDPTGKPPVLPVPLVEYEAPPRSFDAAVAVVSLHHIVPLGASLRHLAGLLRHGAVLVVDELDVDRFDEHVVAWKRSPENAGHELAHLREHIHPLARIMEELKAWFDVGEPVRGPYQYRWEREPGDRAEEEALIAAGEFPATGARFVAVRR
jgi:SAM-dependent methyltransferase